MRPHVCKIFRIAFLDSSGELGGREIHHTVDLFQGKIREFHFFPSRVVVIPRPPSEDLSAVEGTLCTFAKPVRGVATFARREGHSRDSLSCMLP